MRGQQGPKNSLHLCLRHYSLSLMDTRQAWVHCAKETEAESREWCRALRKATHGAQGLRDWRQEVGWSCIRIPRAAHHGASEHRSTSYAL